LKHSAVLFDLDGTLLNTLEDVAGSVNHGLEKLGFPRHPVAEYKNLIGEGRDVLAMKALPENRRDAETGKKLLALINTNYAIHWADHHRPLSGYPRTAGRLDCQSPSKITVLSNKADDLTNICVTKLLARWHFALVAGSRPTIPNKPDPAGALQLASKRVSVRRNSFIWVIRISI